MYFYFQQGLSDYHPQKIIDRFGKMGGAILLLNTIQAFNFGGYKKQYHAVMPTHKQITINIESRTIFREYVFRKHSARMLSKKHECYFKAFSEVREGFLGE